MGNEPEVKRTVAQKAHAVSPWAALLTALPALLIAWQSGGTANTANDAVRDGTRRDGRLLHHTKRVLDQHAEDIESCHTRMDDMSDALVELYDHVNDDHPDPPHHGLPTMTELPDKPRWQPKPVRSDPVQMTLPERLEDLPEYDEPDWD